MSKPNVNADADAPLDPAMERVRRRLARLLVISIGTMMIGLMAVLGAIVYKAGGSGRSGDTVREALIMPEGFAVTDIAVSDNRILFYGTTAGGETRVVIYDATSAALVADHLVK
ncbi:hypothetical protein [Oricola cellulosilytica]|uniref:Uncharacterized protein n=1 Tax=Oricola cellulosilytica TaxID=1429082 RepID=A0A4R0PD57_9HYPH|nr:hypothetical protein [Oricola cellulosilytica]TCD15422.1 hypothetical protein E0D97_07790 [Oricola cellulosilytica]